jgi:hypothetical protein
MKFSEIVNRVAGVAMPFGGAPWQPAAMEVGTARRRTLPRIFRRRYFRSWSLLMLPIFSTLTSADGQVSPHTRPASPADAKFYASRTLTFEANRGQVQSDAAYLARGRGDLLAFGPSGAALRMAPSTQRNPLPTGRDERVSAAPSDRNSSDRALRVNGNGRTTLVRTR